MFASDSSTPERNLLVRLSMSSMSPRVFKPCVVTNERSGAHLRALREREREGSAFPPTRDIGAIRAVVDRAVAAFGRISLAVSGPTQD